MSITLISQVLTQLAAQPQRICFQEAALPITASDFLKELQQLSVSIAEHGAARWVLCFDDPYQFSVALFAVLLAGKIPVMLPNNKPAVCQQLAEHYDAMLTDIAELTSCVHASATQTNLADLDLQEAQTIVVFTSGSTGTPKKIVKSLQLLSNEIMVLETLFGEVTQQADVFSTVSHQHLYGLLFYILWPLAMGRSIHIPVINYPEQILQHIAQHDKAMLISSPAHLTRLTHLSSKIETTMVFSSGGLLPYQHAQQAQTVLGYLPIEVLGSTETGGIAYRQQHQQDAAWNLLPSVQISIAEPEQAICVQSDFIVNTIRTGDRGQLLKDGRLQLCGRTDNIVKLEGKRVSLTQLSQALLNLPYIKTSQALLIEDNRQSIALVCVPSDEGWALLLAQGKRHLNQLINKHLAQYIDAVALPKRFRYVKSMPLNAQHKVEHSTLLDLFEKPRRQMPVVTRVESASLNCVTLHFTVSGSLIYFIGHFPQTPILPGVVQTNWAIAYSQQYLQIASESIRGISQLKFSQPIKPGMKLSLTLQRSGTGFHFEYKADNNICSRGRVLVTEGL